MEKVYFRQAYKIFISFFILLFLLISCNQQSSAVKTAVINPETITDPLPHDTDDPAIWIDSLNPEKSLVLGTDKDSLGGLYVFNLDGKIDSSRSITGLKRPNNVDVEYGLLLGGRSTDIAVVTERFTHKLRIFRLPDMKPIDNGGIEVFEGELLPEYRDLMGISLYRSATGKIFAIAGRKTGPVDGTYLWQYLLEDDSTGNVKATLVRKFGKYSGLKEIESIAVDDALGYVYYSDEGVGVRKYYADPQAGDQELGMFANEGFTEDNEGISIFTLTDSTGYILVSDQGANKFHIFPREGVVGNPHQHPLLKIINVAATQSDGSEITNYPLSKKFSKGLFVVMSDDKTFHYYNPEKILGDSLLNPLIK